MTDYLNYSTSTYRMKAVSTLFTLIFIISACSTGVKTTSKLSDQEIEKLLIGNWFVSPVDTEFFSGNGISSYTGAHDLFFVSYTDPECTHRFLTADGRWEVDNGRLITTVVNSSNSRVMTPGTVLIDEVIDIDETHKVLRSADDEHLQIRTRSNTCEVQKVSPSGGLIQD